MLEIGYRHNFEVRHEYLLKDIDSDIKVAFLSDLHLNYYSKKLIQKLKEEITHLSPDVIILGGDYVDTPKGRKHFITLLDFFSQYQNVFAIKGNHDVLIGIEKTIRLIRKNNINWLENNETKIKKNVRLSLSKSR